MRLILRTSLGRIMKIDFFRLDSSIFFKGFYYMFFIFILTFILVVLGVCVSQKWRYEIAKLTSFECGFDSLRRSRIPFSMRFFLVALLFLVFDMEIVLLFPYIFSLNLVFTNIIIYRKILCSLFLIILVVGLVHEVNEGRLEWKINS